MSFKLQLTSVRLCNELEKNGYSESAPTAICIMHIKVLHVEVHI